MGSSWAEGASTFAAPFGAGASEDLLPARPFGFGMSREPCYASFGSNFGGPVCCRQDGLVMNASLVCPAADPICGGFISDRRWGTCGGEALPNPLGGHELSHINFVFHSVVAVLFIASVVGALLDAFRPLPCTKGGHPKAWVLSLLLASYTLLYPSFYAELFSFNVYIKVHANLLFIPIHFAHNLTPKPVTETMASFIQALLKSGGWIGAYLIILYALVMPIAKLLLLFVGELLRNTSSMRLRRVSRACIHFVQTVSKWASPDMFAYILLLFVFRSMGKPPEFQSDAALDVGFVYFSIFCVASTFSSLAITLPQVDTRTLQDNGASESGISAKLARPCGQRGMMSFSILLASAFFIFLSWGLFAPCLGLRLDVSPLVAPQGPIPSMALPALRSLHVKEKFAVDVSLWRCMYAMLEWAEGGEVTCFVAFVLLALFVISLTSLDVIFLVLIPLRVFPVDGRIPAVKASHVLKHVSMLDVFCVGVIVLCLAESAYKKYGFQLHVMDGTYVLLLAEACHYALYYAVHTWIRNAVDGYAGLGDGELFSSDDSSGTDDSRSAE